MRIYEHAIVDATIILSARWADNCEGCHPKRYHCCVWPASRQSVNDEAEQFSALEQVSAVCPHSSQDHFSDLWPRQFPDHKVNLKLLLVCRQIYNEAVLIPFSADDSAYLRDRFLYRKPHFDQSDSESDDGENRDFHWMLFLRDLVPDQRRAISTLSIKGYVRHKFDQRDIDALSGLNHLKVALKWDMVSIQDKPDRLIHALDARHERVSGVPIFASANLKKVEIVVELTVWHLDMQAITDQSKQLADWVEGKRAFLLSDQSGLERPVAVANMPEMRY